MILNPEAVPPPAAAAREQLADAYAAVGVEPADVEAAIAGAEALAEFTAIRVADRVAELLGPLLESIRGDRRA